MPYKNEDKLNKHPLKHYTGLDDRFKWFEVKEMTKAAIEVSVYASAARAFCYFTVGSRMDQHIRQLDRHLKQGVRREWGVVGRNIGFLGMILREKRACGQDAYTHAGLGWLRHVM